MNINLENSVQIKRVTSNLNVQDTLIFEKNTYFLKENLKNQRYTFSLKKEKNSFLLAFFIPFFLTALIYALMGVFPFGERSIFTVDLYNQYAPFLYNFRERLLHLEWPFYSLNGGLGFNFYSLWAYYLASPFNVLLLPFSERYLPLGITLLSLTKSGLMASTMLYFFRCGFSVPLCFFQYDEQLYQKNMSLMVAIIYAMNGFVLAYSWNLMWMDALIFLPLILLGITHLIQKGKMTLYVFSLSLCIWSNYYAAFFVCIFSGLYCIYFLIINEQGYTLHFNSKKRFLFLRVFQYFLASMCSLGMSFALLYPVAQSLKMTSAIRDQFPPRFDFLFSVGSFFERFFLGAAPHIRSGLPNIFTSLLTYFALGAYFLIPTIKWKEKVATLVLWAFLSVSLSQNTLNFIWHGLHYPNQIPHRFAFVFVFLNLFILYRVLTQWRFLPFKWSIALFGIQILAFILYYALNETKINQAFQYAFYLNLFFMLFYMFCFFIKPYFSLSQQHFAFLISLIIVTELFLQAMMSFNYIAQTDYYGSHSFFVEHLEEIEHHHNFIQTLERPNTFYRMEVYPKKTSNDPSTYRIPGLSIFSSTQPHGLTKTMKALGYFSNGLNSYVQEQQTPLMDMLLGMKYLIRQKNLGIDKTLETLESPQRESIKQTHQIYRRLYSLPLGYSVSSSASDYSTGKEEAFREQEAFVSALAGKDLDRSLFESLDIKSLESDKNTYVQEVEQYLPDKGFKIKIEKVEDAPKDAEAHFKINIQAQQSGQHYVYVYTSWKASTYAIERQVPLEEREKTELHKTNSGPLLLDLGFIESGKAVSIEVKTKRLDGQSFSIWAKRLNENKLKELYSQFKTNALELEHFQAGYFKGKIKMPTKAYLFLSIPYDPSWTFYSNGKKIESLPMAEAFTLLPLEQGEQEIQAYFVPKFFPFSLGVSIFSLILFVFLYCLFDFIDKKY